MQWTKERHGGFSTASKQALPSPVVGKGPFSYRQVNVASQANDPDSTLSHVKHLIRLRRSCPEWGMGLARVFHQVEPGLFVHSAEWKGEQVIAMHNLLDKRAEVHLEREPGCSLSLLLSSDDGQGSEPGRNEIEPYGFRWYRRVKSPHR
jgi:maltose alpha-D-glucosyltransferase/alpha-amylase